VPKTLAYTVELLSSYKTVGPMCIVHFISAFMNALLPDTIYVLKTASRWVQARTSSYRVPFRSLRSVYSCLLQQLL